MYFSYDLRSRLYVDEPCFSLQGVVGLVFGNENSGSNEDRYMSCLISMIMDIRL